MKYFSKLLTTCAACMLVATLIVLAGGNMRLRIGGRTMSRVVYEKGAGSAEPPAGYEEELPALILYSPEDKISEKYRANLEDVFYYLKRECESLPLENSDSISYKNYSCVVLASNHIETELADGADRLFSYVKEGGRLFWGMVQNETGFQFQSVYKKMGIIDYNDYVDYKSLTFNEDLLPGLKGERFGGEGFGDVGLHIILTDSARVWAETRVNRQQIPVIWSVDHGKGRVVCYNGTSLTGDYYRGIAAGCIHALSDDVMYPIINAKIIFIDDFPSPQYESESDIVRKTYNRSVKEFYRDIWWPDMQKAANKAGFLYTGVFITTYNNIVDPEDFEFTESSMMRYYGNSLLRAGHEMGAHGYNHQSLAGKGEVPEDMDYEPWACEADMEASIVRLREIEERLFPKTPMKTYVPPSNYLSKEGRVAVEKALPELKIVSGVYTMEGESGSVYVQRFHMAEDGIAEFPRISAGMQATDFDRIAYISALGLHGVFSHFIHPDDIFDAERGGGRSWEELLEGYEAILKDVNRVAGNLRSLTASEAADALKVWQEMKPRLVYETDCVKGSIENFRGEAYFYLCTDKQPISQDDACTITGEGKNEGRTYYLVTAHKPEFTIKLEEKEK